MSRDQPSPPRRLPFWRGWFRLRRLLPEPRSSLSLGPSLSPNQLQSQLLSQRWYMSRFLAAGPPRARGFSPLAAQELHRDDSREIDQEPAFLTICWLYFRTAWSQSSSFSGSLVTSLWLAFDVPTKDAPLSLTAALSSSSHFVLFLSLHPPPPKSVTAAVAYSETDSVPQCALS